VAAGYEETLEFLYSRLPVFQRVGAAAYKPGLENILRFCTLIGNPQEYFPTIHIAGTNGKGSTSHSIASVLQEAGYKTGLYTSPHLVDFRERIRINGEMLPREWVVEKVQTWKPFIAEIQPSFFELTVALAFVYFAENQVDIAVIEVGMGGRLDSTNIIRPLVSLITNIGYDHQQFLGNTLPEIAAEKAGIMKAHTPVVISETNEEISRVFQERGRLVSSDLIWAEAEWDVLDLGITAGLRETEVQDKKSGQKTKHLLSLLGDYQLKNIKGILSCLRVLQAMGFAVTDAHIRLGLKQVQTNTGLMGRWQILQKNPTVVCDTGHNEDGIRMVIRQLDSLKPRQLWMVWGMVSDKEHGKILKLLPKNAHYLITEPRSPRAMPREKMNALFLENGLETSIFDTVPLALQYALHKADKEDIIFIGGSTFTVADIPFEKFSPLR
jgi:dihydrofolate synthase/folylpolyglutamate synthase